MNDTSKPEHRELADTELDGVTGGATPKLYEVASKGTHPPMSSRRGEELTGPLG